MLHPRKDQPKPKKSGNDIFGDDVFGGDILSVKEKNRERTLIYS